MTTYTITADEVDAARAGVIVVDGEEVCPSCQMNSIGASLSGDTVAAWRCLACDHRWRGAPAPRPPSWATALTEPCQNCGGSGYGVAGSTAGGFFRDGKFRPRGGAGGQTMTAVNCPDCDGHGRPLLDVEWGCVRCRHSPDWHTLRDDQGVGPTDHEARFKCYGHDRTDCDFYTDSQGNRRIIETCACPDFVRESFRFRVDEVAPVTKNDTDPRRPIVSMQHGHPCLLDGTLLRRITLPPGDHVGRYVLLIEVEGEGE